MDLWAGSWFSGHFSGHSLACFVALLVSLLLKAKLFRLRSVVLRLQAPCEGGHESVSVLCLV